MLLLPHNLKAVTHACGKDGRFAVDSVFVESLDEGKRYAVTTTDCHRMIHVEGRTDDASEYPLGKVMTEAPNGATSALIPAKFFAEQMAGAAKLIKARVKPILNNVAVQMSDTVATMSYTDLNQTPVAETRLVEGHFPSYRDLIPKKRGVLSVWFDPKHFYELADAIKAISPMLGDEKRIWMDIYGGNKPVIFRATSDRGQEITGLIKPRAADEDPNGFKLPEVDKLCDEDHWQTLCHDLKKVMANNDLEFEKIRELNFDLSGENRKLVRLLSDKPDDLEGVWDEFKDEIRKLKKEIADLTKDRDEWIEEHKSVQAELEAIKNVLPEPPYSVTEQFELADQLAGV